MWTSTTEVVRNGILRRLEGLRDHGLRQLLDEHRGVMLEGRCGEALQQICLQQVFSELQGVRSVELLERYRGKLSDEQQELLARALMTSERLVLAVRLLRLMDEQLDQWILEGVSKSSAQKGLMILQAFVEVGGKYFWRCFHGNLEQWAPTFRAPQLISEKFMNENI